jgi:putative polyhydroxyalkanoate system protein
MSNIHIQRDHDLGLSEARKIAAQWKSKAEQDFDMQCTLEKGRAQDIVHFQRSGVKGQLTVTANRFELEATLGMLLGMFKGKIEAEIVRNLDDLLA